MRMMLKDRTEVILTDVSLLLTCWHVINTDMQLLLWVQVSCLIINQHWLCKLMCHSLVCHSLADTSLSLAYWCVLVACLLMLVSHLHILTLLTTQVALLIILAASRSRILHILPYHAHHLYLLCPSLQHLFCCFLVTLALLVHLWPHCWVCYFGQCLHLLWCMDTLVDNVHYLLLIQLLCYAVLSYILLSMIK